MIIAVLCPACSNYFDVPVERDDSGIFPAPIPEHEPCDSLESQLCYSTGKS